MNKWRILFTFFRETISTNGNTTTSTISLIPSAQDNGDFITCRAENIRMPDSIIEDKLHLDVYCKFIKISRLPLNLIADKIADEPVVKLYLKTQDQNSRIVREHDYITMECRAEGRPSSFEYQWTFNDVTIPRDSPRKN